MRSANPFRESLQKLFNPTGIWKCRTIQIRPGMRPEGNFIADIVGPGPTPDEKLVTIETVGRVYALERHKSQIRAVAHRVKQVSGTSRHHGFCPFSHGARYAGAICPAQTATGEPCRRGSLVAGRGRSHRTPPRQHRQAPSCHQRVRQPVPREGSPLGFSRAKDLLNAVWHFPRIARSRHRPVGGGGRGGFVSNW